MASRYFRRHWDEPRADQFRSWGEATYWFEVSDDWRTVRQIEVYDDGHVLRYGPDHPYDEYGFLSEEPGDPNDFSPFEVDHRTFEDAWQRGA